MEGRTIVVGGGVMGAAIARSVALRTDPIEAPVVLFEKSHLAAGSSGRSGAILRQFYSDGELVRIARDSLRVYARFQNDDRTRHRFPTARRAHDRRSSGARHD